MKINGVAIASGSSTIILKSQTLTSTSWSLVSENAVGTMSNTAPTGVGEIVRIIGYAVGDAPTTDRIYFNPSNDWIEL